MIEFGLRPQQQNRWKSCASGILGEASVAYTKTTARRSSLLQTHSLQRHCPVSNHVKGGGGAGAGASLQKLVRAASFLPVPYKRKVVIIMAAALCQKQRGIGSASCPPRRSSDSLVLLCARPAI